MTDREMIFRSTLTFILFICILPFGSDARAEGLFPSCSVSFDHFFSDKVFHPYAVRVRVYKRVHVNTKFGRAHLYRTVISEDANRGAEFSGHYTISLAGCGTRTSCIAIVDQRTGQVYFPPKLLEASKLFVDTGKVDYNALYYRINSDLLILVGSANENAKTEGVSYYLWRSNNLHLIRRISIANICAQTP